MLFNEIDIIKRFKYSILFSLPFLEQKRVKLKVKPIKALKIKKKLNKVAEFNEGYFERNIQKKTVIDL